MKIIITGATGMVGEGVLLNCLQNDEVKEILIINRKHFDFSHPKLKELLVPDFLKIEEFKNQLSGYDACFYCAGISSVGLNEEVYTKITYDTTLHFANVLADINTDTVFNYISGSHTDSSEKGKIMWARVKGKTENDLLKLNLGAVYNFRPGFMKPVAGQKNVKSFFKPIIWLFPKLLPSKALTLHQIGNAMVNLVQKPFNKAILEIDDIKKVAANNY